MKEGGGSVGGSSDRHPSYRVGQLSRIKSLMERERGCGPGLVTGMILEFITD